MTFLKRFDGRASYINYKTGVTGVVAQQSEPIDRLDFFVPDHHFNAHPKIGPKFSIQTGDTDYDPNDPYADKPKQPITSNRLTKENNMDAFYEAQRIMDLNAEDDPIYSLRRLREITEEDYNNMDPDQQNLLEQDPASPQPKIDGFQYYNTNKVRSEITSRQYGMRNSQQPDYMSDPSFQPSSQRGLLKLHSASVQSLPNSRAYKIDQRYDSANELLSKYHQQQSEQYNEDSTRDTENRSSQFEQLPMIMNPQMKATGTMTIRSGIGEDSRKYLTQRGNYVLSNQMATPQDGMLYDYGTQIARAVSTERFSPGYPKSVELRNVNEPYKKYTLKQYKALQQQAANLKRGGLGANLYTDDWIKKKEKTEKMMIFAESVRVSHVKGMPLSEVRKSRPDEVKFVNYRESEQVERSKHEPLSNHYIMSHRNKFHY